MTPRVSVMLPTYNRPEWLAQSIDSVLGQTYQDFELIVLDNGSTPRANVPANPRIRTIVCTENNLCCPWRTMATIARGDYLVFWTDDDLMEPENLEKKVAMLEENEDLGFVWSPVTEINPVGGPVGLQKNGWVGDEEILAQAAPFDKLILGNFVPMMSAVFRRKLFAMFGTPGFGSLTDWAFWLECSRASDSAYTPERLVKLRLHHQSDSAQRGVKEGDFLKQLPAIWNHWRGRGWIPSPEQIESMRFLYLKTAYDHYRALMGVM